ncbi:MBL fold metallo-hydrolase [Yunchengibacter salinarum]|uniref:MBL fold metallo-hydrolase n=1 Tax=Yunchengibacter salinarum TaxID=3133399 RepID=UPI0035B5EAC9
MAARGKPGFEAHSANPEIRDHRQGARARDGVERLSYPLGTAPAPACAIPVAKGIYWARIPLPWALDHINVYLFDDGDGWTIVDTGAQGNRGRDAWAALEQAVLGDKPVTRVIATHMHPDHVGLAGWLVDRHGSADLAATPHFHMPQAEYLLAHLLWFGASHALPENEIAFLLRAGVDPQMESMIRAHGYGNYKKGVSALPSSYHRLADGQVLTLAGRRWQVVIGRGHSPEHACLACLDEPLFLSGDQVLPGITSNVSVYAREPDANPLAHWLLSLERLQDIPGDPLVLPSHGRVFRGLHRRLYDLSQGHLEKLADLWRHLQAGPCSVVACFPALYRREIKGLDFFLALGEAVAHLNLLMAVGLVARDRGGPVDHYVATGRLDPDQLMPRIRALPGEGLPALAMAAGTV